MQNSKDSERHKEDREARLATLAPLLRTRIRNLEHLARQWGGLRLGKKLGYRDGSFISQLTAGLRPITEKTAETIEKKLELAPGWMSMEHSGDGADTSAAPLAGVADSGLLAHALKTVLEIAPELDADKKAGIVTLVYTQALQSGHVDVGYVQQLCKLARG